MRKLIMSLVLLFLLMFSAFSETAFAERPWPGASPEGMQRPLPEKMQPKCQRSAAKYLKDAEERYGGISPESSIAASLLYQICSQLEQQNK